jgi:hypothetical protein
MNTITDNNVAMVKVIPSQLLGQIKFKHILVECQECHRTWGAHCNEQGEIPAKNLRCFECDSKKLQQLLENKE